MGARSRRRPRWAAGDSRRRTGRRLITALLTGALLAGCTSSTVDTTMAPTPQAESQDVDAATALDISIDGLVHVTAPAGTFSAAGTVTVAPVEQSDPGVVGLSPAGTGIDVTFDGVAPSEPLHVEFTDVAAKPVDDAVPAVLHQLEDGTWDTEAAEATDGGIAFDATTFSLRVPAWLDPRPWLADRVDSIADSLTARTDPPVCAGGGPGWASLQPGTTLMHTCLITNPSSGGDRAEVQFAPNRRFFVWTSIPAEMQYTWVSDQEDALRALLGLVVDSFDSDTSALLGPGTMLTAGIPQPATDRDLVFTSYLDPVSVSMSLGATVLGLLPLDPKSLFLATLLLVTKCSQKIPTDIHDVDETFLFVKCAAQEGLALLADPRKAVGEATEQFGDAAFGQQAVDGLTARAGQLRLLGQVFKVLGLTAAVRDIWVEIPDLFSQNGTDRPGDTTLSLTGRAVVPQGPVLTTTGMGPIEFGDTVEVASAYLDDSLANDGGSCWASDQLPGVLFVVHDGIVVGAGSYGPDVGAEQLVTDRGISMDSTGAEILAAYPGMTSATSSGDAYTDQLTWLDGDGGVLQAAVSTVPGEETTFSLFAGLLPDMAYEELCAG